MLTTATSFEPAALDELLKQFVATQGMKVGDLVHTRRVAVTGKSVGPASMTAWPSSAKTPAWPGIDRALAR